MSFKRKIYSDLVEWKDSSVRKPLILRGARQVGKTTLIKYFSENYSHSIFLNLEKNEHFSYFEMYDDVETILEVLFLRFSIPASKRQNTLLFIDEIQESPKAIQMLRYFYEEASDIHVIAAGSLLEFAMKYVESFPVGRVEFLYLHPLNFQEYLGAIGKDNALEQLLHIPLNLYAHTILMDLFHRYAIVGGMPEVVQTEIHRGHIGDLAKVYESLWATYKNDIEKYADNETDRKVTKHIISNAYLYVEQRVKFQNFGNSNYRSREVGEAFRSLDDARIIRLIYPTTDVEVPLKPDFKKSPKLQFLDTGLLNYALKIQTDMLEIKDLSSSYKGAIIPHMFMQELISVNAYSEHKPMFWVRDKKQSDAEVDLILEYKNYAIPIEIKSGATGSLKSLHQFIDAAPHEYAVRIYGGQFCVEKTKTPSGKQYLLMNLPYYLGTKLMEYVEWFVKNNNLD